MEDAIPTANTSHAVIIMHFPRDTLDQRALDLNGGNGAAARSVTPCASPGWQARTRKAWLTEHDRSLSASRITRANSLSGLAHSLRLRQDQSGHV